MSKKKDPRMNAKRKAMLKALASGANVSEAGRMAGYGTYQAAHKALNRIKINAPEILERIGCPAEVVLRKMVQKLEAKETKYFAHEGRVKDRRTVQANDIQLRAADMLGKIYGLYPREADEAGSAFVGPSFTVVIANAEVANALVGRLAERSALDSRSSVVDAARNQDAR